MKTWQIILVTAIVAYMLHSKISSLPGISNLPTL